jgi:ActR/RegA family two-component response regulator
MLGTWWHIRRVLQEPPRCLSLTLKELQQNEHRRALSELLLPGVLECHRTPEGS